ncbi:methyltransferase domain-containing protein [Leucobacter sp. OH2974_COT-288]|nr:methyltransferase domain-containing protein [Leucobacter sp. OH2974_COT-288]
MSISRSDQARTYVVQHASSLDRLILEHAAPFLGFENRNSNVLHGEQRATFSQLPSAEQHAGDVLVLEDENLALTFACLAALLESEAQNNIAAARVFVRLRSYRKAKQLAALLQQHGSDMRERVFISGLDQNGNIDPETLDLQEFLAKHQYRGGIALGKLPKSRAALATWAKAFARQAEVNTTGTIILGGVVKHMTRNFNDTLGEFFHTVRGTRGRGKHRCLIAAQVKNSGLAAKNAAVQPNAAKLYSYGGVFSGAKPDRGGEFLAQHAVRQLATMPEGLRILDLGCGNGSVTRHILNSAEAGKIAEVHATDIDADAVLSATVNLAHDVRATVSWDDAGARIHPGTIDMVLLNPPFHEGTKIDMTLVRPLLDAAHRIMRPGGMLLLVHNSHARYRDAVEKRFKNVTQVGRDAVFTVLRAQL